MRQINQWWNGIGYAARLEHANNYFTTDDSNLTPTQIKKIYEAEVIKPCLAGVTVGILSDEDLKIAINHYTSLVDLLRPHGSIYKLVYRDAEDKLNRLLEMQKLRKQK